MSDFTAPQYSKQQLHDYLQWDIETWKHAIRHWDGLLGQAGCGSGGTSSRRYTSGDAGGGDHSASSNGSNNDNRPQALELGARDGGLSLFLAERGMQVVCSDLNGPSELARELHLRHGLGQRISYEAINATAIPFDTARFDVVIFKSVLGGVGMHQNFAAINTAVGEMQRVLKPGGLLLFAENQRGSLVHRQARQRFVEWGKVWYYVSLDELKQLLTGFEQPVIKTYGYLSCVKKDFAPFVLADRLLCRRSQAAGHYMAYGHARKPIK